jgi:uncharacterized protein YqeY
MLRERLNEALREALKARRQREVSTVRMVLATLKDRDIAARPQGNANGIDDGQIVTMLKGMIKQRQESIVLYRQGGREELAAQEAEEIAIIEGFMPKQMDEAEAEAAIKAAIAATGAASIKDMGKVMAELRVHHAATMDFGRAGAMVKRLLG